MGLIDFFADLETSSKLNEKYGLGASFAYLDMREQQELAKSQVKEQKRQQKLQQVEDEVEKLSTEKMNQTINEMQASLNENIRISTYFRQKLIKIMNDLEASNNCHLCTAFKNEFNSLLYDAKYCRVLNLCIEQLEEAIKNELGTVKPHENMELESQFIKVYNSKSKKEIQNNYKELKTYLYEKYKFRISDRTQKQIDDALKDIR